MAKKIIDFLNKTFRAKMSVDAILLTETFLTIIWYRYFSEFTHGCTYWHLSQKYVNHINSSNYLFLFQMNTYVTSWSPIGGV